MNSNLRILILYGGFLSNIGGVSLNSQRLKFGFEDMGYTAEVISLESLNILLRYLPHGIEKVVNLFYFPFGFLCKGVLTKYLFRLKLIFSDYDIYIFQDIYLSWKTNKKSLTIIHAVWSDNLQSFKASKRIKKFKGFEAHKINALKDNIFTVSDKYKDYLIQDHFNMWALKELGVLNLGIDQNRFLSNKSISQYPKSLLYVGSLEARKNVKFLIEVFFELSKLDKDYKLTIIGDGPMRGELEEMSKLEKANVIFLGALPNEEVIKHQFENEFYIHTSVKESFSYSLLEAKLAGMKTIAWGDLQVPAEFIDLPMRRFNKYEWSQAIFNNFAVKDFNRHKFTISSMCNNILRFVYK